MEAAAEQSARSGLTCSFPTSLASRASCPFTSTFRTEPVLNLDGVSVAILASLRAQAHFSSGFCFPRARPETRAQARRGARREPRAPALPAASSASLCPQRGPPGRLLPGAAPRGLWRRPAPQTQRGHGPAAGSGRGDHRGRGRHLAEPGSPRRQVRSRGANARNSVHTPTNRLRKLPRRR